MVVQEVRSGSLTLADFREHFEKPAVPLIIRGGAADWPCTSKWSIPYLRDRFGDRSLRVAGRPAPIQLGPHLDEVLAFAAGHATAEPPPYLIRNIWLYEVFPELAADVRVPEFVQDNWFEKLPVRAVCDKRWIHWMEFFVGGAGARYPFIHQDILGTHAWLAQIAGRKRYWVWQPDAKPGRGALAPGDKELVGYGRNGWNKVDFETDLRSAFPDDEPGFATLEPGDVIFIPSLWWHTVETLEPSINLSGNWFNGSNWPQVQRIAALKRSSDPKAFGSRTYRKVIDRLYA